MLPSFNDFEFGDKHKKENYFETFKTKYVQELFAINIIVYMKISCNFAISQLKSLRTNYCL